MEAFLHSKYYKDTESNILSASPAGEIRLGFSLDTLSLFVSDGTRWFKFELEDAS